MKHDFHLISLSNVFEQHKLIRYVVTCDCWDLNSSQKAIVMKCKKILSVCTFLHFSTRAAAVERSLEVCKQVSTRQALRLNIDIESFLLNSRTSSTRQQSTLNIRYAHLDVAAAVGVVDERCCIAATAVVRFNYA